MKLILSLMLTMAVKISMGQTTIVSSTSGSWSSASTWDLKRIPLDGDIVVINNNTFVTINDNIIINNAVLRVQGSLTVNDNKSLRLNGNGVINVVTGGRISAENHLAGSMISLAGVTKYRGNKTFNPGWGEGVLNGLANASSSTGDIDFGGPGFVMGALPATWQDLNVFRTSDNMVQMVWVTSHETGTRIFDIERSGESLQWQRIGSISSSGNQGQSNIYDFVDSKPLSGLNYYRILQKDPDGKIKYTSVRFISIGKALAISGYPNPAVSNFRVDFAKSLGSQMQLKMVNAEGKLVMLKTAGKGTRYIDIPVASLRQGVYFIQCAGEDGNAVILKMVR
jgi:Secretion system C-terminal sorting domain/G8 domain